MFFDNLIQLLMLLIKDLLILLYCRFNNVNLHSNLFSLICLKIFKKLEPVFYPKPFCSKCSSFNFNKQ